MEAPSLPCRDGYRKPKPTRLILCANDTTKALVKVTTMICRKCGNKSAPEYYFVCSECYSRGENMPTSVSGSAWIRTLVPREQGKERLSRESEKVKRLILASFHDDKIAPDPTRKAVVVGGMLEVPVEEKAIDQLADQSGLVVGKWLIYASPENINDVWKTIASSTLRNELGIGTKVSTAPKEGEHVICVYTRNYLDVDDVKGVRKRLAQLGFAKRLFYKPNIYTYLKIYSKTFPGIRASRYAE